MAKKVRNKSKKVRSFKVHTDAYGIPFVRFGGKYLPKELGISCGDRLEMTRDGDSIMLRKYSADEVAKYEAARQAKALLKQLFSLKHQMSPMMVAENRSTYSVEDEISKQIERYLQD